jgi:hypothetical protein
LIVVVVRRTILSILIVLFWKYKNIAVMFQQKHFFNFFLLGVAAMSARRIEAETPVVSIFSVQLSNVASIMSSEVQDVYERTLEGFYSIELKGAVSNVTVAVASQTLESAPAPRLRRLQANTPLNTVLMVSANAVDSSNTTGENLSRQLVSTINDAFQVIMHLLKAADPYFSTLDKVEGLSISTTQDSDTTPEIDEKSPTHQSEDSTSETDVMAPATTRKVQTAPGTESGFFFNNPQGVKTAISIATLWVISVVLGVGILIIYPEDKVPENWKSVTSS